VHALTMMQSCSVPSSHVNTAGIRVDKVSCAQSVTSIAETKAGEAHSRDGRNVSRAPVVYWQAARHVDLIQSVRIAQLPHGSRLPTFSSRVMLATRALALLKETAQTPAPVVFAANSQPENFYL
jgi:hypothetical protein